MPGCHRHASLVAEIEGIYSGIYIDKLFYHCGHHKPLELSHELESCKLEAINSAAKVNPFTAANLSKHAS